MISFKNGDLLKSSSDIIAHQVNLQGNMGGGLAKQIAAQYPECEIGYKDFIARAYWLNGNTFLYHSGKNNLFIANCFSQNEDFTTNYEWLKKCFSFLKSFMEKAGFRILGVPFNYGCGIAHGEWEKVLKIFKELFENEQDIELQIWRFNFKEINYGKN